MHKTDETARSLRHFADEVEKIVTRGESDELKEVLITETADEFRRKLFGANPGETIFACIQRHLREAAHKWREVEELFPDQDPFAEIERLKAIEEGMVGLSNEDIRIAREDVPGLQAQIEELEGINEDLEAQLANPWNNFVAIGRRS